MGAEKDVALNKNQLKRKEERKKATMLQIYRRIAVVRSLDPPASLSMCLCINRQWASCNNIEIHTNQSHDKAYDHVSFGFHDK